MGIGPFPPDEVPVPAEQGLGLYEEPASAAPVEQSSEPGEQGNIRRSQSRSDDLTAKHGNLVAEHDDFDRQLVPISPTQAHQLGTPDERDVEKLKCHDP